MGRLEPSAPSKHRPKHCGIQDVSIVMVYTFEGRKNKHYILMLAIVVVRATLVLPLSLYSCSIEKALKLSTNGNGLVVSYFSLRFLILVVDHPP